MREFPPLRAAWAKRGQQQVVVISGRNGRRVILGALSAASGEFVSLIRERSRQDDCLAFVETLGQVRPAVPKLLIWDNAPPHHPNRVQAAAAEALHIHIAWLPFRSPELNPDGDQEGIECSQRPGEKRGQDGGVLGGAQTVPLSPGTSKHLRLLEMLAGVP